MSRHQLTNRRRIGLVTAFVVLASLFTLVGPASVAAAASITGTITDEAVQPIENIEVSVCQKFGAGGCFTDDTDTNGEYSVAALTAGNYYVQIRDLSGFYRNENWDDTGSQPATNVALVDGQTFVANAVLRPIMLTTFTGTVRNSSGTGIEDIEVCVRYPIGSACPFSTTTIADGTFSFPFGFNEDDYLLYFGGRTEGYGDFYYDNQTGYDQADVITFANGDPVDLDITLASLATISGTVTNAQGFGVNGVEAKACVYLGLDCHTSLVLNGDYSILVTPGQHYVSFTDVGLGVYAPANHVVAPDPIRTLVTATGGATTTGIDAVMIAEGAITGRVFDTNGMDIVGVKVRATEVGTHNLMGEVETGADGRYALPDVLPGTYNVRFTHPDYVTEYYGGVTNRADADPVTVLPQAATSDINGQLGGAGKISGTIIDPHDRNLNWGVTACLDVGAFCTSASETSYSDTNGAYEIVSLPPGDYLVFLLPTSLHPRIFHDGTLDPAAAGSVAVTVGATTSGIDITLVDLGSLSGTVTGPGGDPIAGSVEACLIGGGCFSASAGADGTYLFDALPTGGYTVEFSANGLVPEFHGGAALAANATTVVVAANTETTAINGSLTAGGSISGTVRTRDGRQIFPVQVIPRACSVSAGYCRGGVQSNGVYEIQTLRAATDWIIEFETSGSILGEFWDDSPTAAEATPITVTADETTPNIDALLSVDGEDPRDPQDLPSALVTPITPIRLADTRQGADTIDNQFAADGQIAAGTSYEVQIAGRSSMPATATAAVLNITALRSASAGFITVFPCTGDVPTASSINFAAQEISPNEVLAKLSADGTVCLFASSDVDIIIDAVGHLDDDSAYVALSPARFVDTRPGEQTVDGAYAAGGRVLADTEIEVQITGRDDVPVGAAAVVMNVTSVGSGADGFLTLHPCGARPEASSLNVQTGRTRPNELVATLSAAGSVCVYSSTSTDLLIDVVGYVPSSGGYAALTPARLLDTRPGQSSADGTGELSRVVPAGEVIEIQVAGRVDIDENATAAVVNVAVVQPHGAGFLTVYPCGELPNASSLNFGVGETRANELIAKLSLQGTICLRATANTHLLVDVTGSLG